MLIRTIAATALVVAFAAPVFASPNYVRQPGVVPCAMGVKDAEAQLSTADVSGNAFDEAQGHIAKATEAEYAAQELLALVRGMLASE